MTYFINHSVTVGAWLQRRLRRLRSYALAVLALSAVGLAAGQRPEALSTEATADRTLAGLVIAVDPGHGGYDGGARARDSGIWEKELTLRIAKAVEQELTARGAQVVLTRREDVCLCEGDTASRARKRADLTARRDIAETAGAHALISIHLNEYRSRAESGPQVFYQRGGDEGRLLAGALQQALISGLKPSKQRKAMAGDYFVLRGKTPSVLVECGFLSNAEEEKKLLNAAYQQKIACSLADGLALWRQLRQEKERGAACAGSIPML